MNLKGRSLTTQPKYYFGFSAKMLGKPGKHVFVVEANHDKIIAEKHYFNNIGKQEFEVLKDKSNPFLDVYFDGQKILDGDIVSTKPNIKLMLKDENAFCHWTILNYFP